MNEIVRTSAAFNVDAIRNNVVKRLMPKTLERLEEMLDATQEKHFSFNGEVRDTKVVIDNAARLSAIDKVLSVSGAYVKDREPPKHDNSIYIEIDPVTGVHKIVIGVAPPALPPESEVLDEVINQQQNPELTAIVGSTPPVLHLVPPPSDDEEPDEVPEVYKRGKYLPEAIRRRMFRDSDM